MFARLLPLALILLAGCSAPPASPPADEDVSYPAGSDTIHAVLFHPTGSGPSPALIVVHGDYGLTDGVKVQARRLAGKGYVVLAVDLYRGEGAGDLLDAHILSRGVPDERALGDLQAAADYLTRRPDVQHDALGILGWETGGGYALDAARQDSRIRAVVTCYGRLVTDPALLTNLRASVLGIFAERDQGISPETIDQFRAAMQKAGKRVPGLHVYPACDPGFLEPGSDAVQTRADAWARIEAYLAAELKP